MVPPKIHLIFTCIEQNDLLPKFLEHYKYHGCCNAVCLLEDHVDRSIVLEVFPNAIIYQGKVSLDATIRQEDDNWLRKKIPKYDWYVIADVDEFVFSEKRLIDVIQRTSCDNIRGYLVDRHTNDLSLPQTLDEDIWKQFPVETTFTKDHGVWDQKVIAAVNILEIKIGHHYCDSNNFDENKLPIHHFKWWGNVINRLKERNKIPLFWNEELDAQLATLTRGDSIFLGD